MRNAAILLAAGSGKRMQGVVPDKVLAPLGNKPVFAHSAAAFLESNVADLRRVIATAANRAASGVKTILFIDEIHRWNKAQQDVLLPDVERGTVRLIGATTHNPGFYVNPPLLSRSHLFRLEPLLPAEIAGPPCRR